MPLNIAHINLAKGLRGGENQTLAIINGLSVFDVRQVLICRKNSLLEKQAQKLNIPSIGIRKPFLLSVSKLKSFDLIHVHEGRSIYFALAANLLFKKPYLVTRRILNKPHEKWLTKLAYRRAEFIVSISHNIDDVMREFLPQHTYKVIPDIARVLISNPNEVNELKKEGVARAVREGKAELEGLIELIPELVGDVVGLDEEESETEPHGVAVGFSEAVLELLRDGDPELLLEIEPEDVPHEDAVELI
jgi:hypothetical protein